MATANNRAYLASRLRHSAQICSADAPQTTDISNTLYEVLTTVINNSEENNG